MGEGKGRHHNHPERIRPVKPKGQKLANVPLAVANAEFEFPEEFELNNVEPLPPKILARRKREIHALINDPNNA